MLLAYVHAALVVEEPVVALADHGHDGVVEAGPRLALHGPAHGRVVDGADSLRVGQHDRRLDEAPLADRAAADDLADAVGGEDAGDDAPLPEAVAVREHGGDARAGGPAAGGQLGPAPRDGAVADEHAGHVGDRVQRPDGQDADRDTEIARPGATAVTHD